MKVQFGVCRLELVQGDITEQEVDAIVNAANQKLGGRRGRGWSDPPRGRADVDAGNRGTLSRRLPHRERGGDLGGEPECEVRVPRRRPVVERRAQRRAGIAQIGLQNLPGIGGQTQCESIAFPAISTGVYRYPLDLAAEDSLSVTRDFLLEHQQPRLVRFVLFGEGAYGAFSRVLETMTE